MRSYSILDATRVPAEVITAELRGEIPMDDADIAQFEDFKRCNNCQQKIAGSIRQHKMACRPTLESLVMDPISDEWQAYLDRRWPNRAERRAQIAAEKNLIVEGLLPALAPIEEHSLRADYHDTPLYILDTLRRELRYRSIAALAY